MTIYDASQLVYDYLRNSAKAQAATIRSELVLGARSIIESGWLVEETLRQAIQAREADALLADKALLLIVQDAGDSALRQAGNYDEYVVVRVVDRAHGYKNIRRAKEALKKNLYGIIGNLNAGGSAATGVRYVTRTGHRYDPNYHIEYDALSFAVITAYMHYQ